MLFRLAALGELSLYDSEPGRKLAVPKKALALLALLATAGPKGVSRERALSLLWPDAEDSGRGALKQTIYELRQTLGNRDALTGTDVLTLDATQIASDITDIEAAQNARESARVVALYAGPFLERFHVRGSAEFDHWVDSRRAHYNEVFRRALERSAVDAAKNGDVHASIALWRRLAAEDPLGGPVALGPCRPVDPGWPDASRARNPVVPARFFARRCFGG